MSTYPWRTWRLLLRMFLAWGLILPFLWHYDDVERFQYMRLQWTESPQRNIQVHHDKLSLTVRSIDLVAIRENGLISQLSIINVKEPSKLQDQRPLPCHVFAEERAQFQRADIAPLAWLGFILWKCIAAVECTLARYNISLKSRLLVGGFLTALMLALTHERATVVTSTWFREES